MTVLITGGTGFVGLNLAEALLTRGERVVVAGLDQPPEAALRRFAQLPGTLTAETVDVRDEAGLGALFRRSKYAVERTGLRLGALWALDVIAARIGALFGPWERDTGLRDTLSPFWQAAQLARQGREAVLPRELPSYSFVYARDASAGLLWLLDLPAPSQRVFNVCGGVDIRSALPAFCRSLAARYPGFSQRLSDDPVEINVQPSDMRPRGRLATNRLLQSGWSAAFDEVRAGADYLAFLEQEDDGSHVG